MYEDVININDYEFPIRIEYSLIREERGSRNEYGVQMEPDYPAYIEVEGTEIQIEGKWYAIDLPEVVLTDTINDILEGYLG